MDETIQMDETREWWTCLAEARENCSFGTTEDVNCCQLNSCQPHPTILASLIGMRQWIDPTHNVGFWEACHEQVDEHHGPLFAVLRVGSSSRTCSVLWASSPPSRFACGPHHHVQCLYVFRWIERYSTILYVTRWNGYQKNDIKIQLDLNECTHAHSCVSNQMVNWR